MDNAGSSPSDIDLESMQKDPPLTAKLSEQDSDPVTP
jgi:hypothetical protein